MANGKNESRNRIICAAGNMYIADLLEASLEHLRPSSKVHQKMVERMKRELCKIRNAEYVIAHTGASNG